ncbi:MAG: repressor LexA [Candidatus Pacebacteria bacterium CG10_big_fil_rev_8_21_14_0_10_42_12]|nr:MAG: repressor LexA [Candidatus Pacebacteria bacterium CG10_big_fil_rev_8_21_14_0_10_42_12]
MRKIVRMNKKLTSKQKQVLSTIIDLIQKLGHEPTLEQVRSALDYTSTSSVQRHTDSLKELGYLSKSRGLSLPDTDQTVQIPLVGNVACGAPLLAIENIEAYIPYDSTGLRGNSDDYFFLRAVGDSMDATNVNGKTIDDGDYVLVKKQDYPDFGKRIVALIGENATIKRLKRGDGHIILEPESNNPANKPIYVFEEISVQGVAEDVIKKGFND